tara:strand:+ start:5584 stop:6099 length:516 start_codon:yes stop_codon:yes gene_type:complete
MEYLPTTLKTLHLGVAGLGLYVAIEGQDKLWPGSSSSTTTAAQANSGFQKDEFMSAAYIVTVIACLQLAVLYYFHNYRGKESHFRLAYFVLAIVNLIFGAIVLQGAATLLKKPAGSGAGVSVVTDKMHDVAVAGAVLGALVIAFNFVNLYHAGHAMVRPASARGRGSPRRK